MPAQIAASGSLAPPWKGRVAGLPLTLESDVFDVIPSANVEKIEDGEGLRPIERGGSVDGYRQRAVWATI
jgi:hypothetical protein